MPTGQVDDSRTLQQQD